MSSGGESGSRRANSRLNADQAGLRSLSRQKSLMVKVLMIGLLEPKKIGTCANPAIGTRINLPQEQAPTLDQIDLWQVEASYLSSFLRPSLHLVLDVALY